MQIAVNKMLNLVLPALFDFFVVDPLSGVVAVAEVFEVALVGDVVGFPKNEKTNRYATIGIFLNIYLFYLNFHYKIIKTSHYYIGLEEWLRLFNKILGGRL